MLSVSVVYGVVEVKKNALENVSQSPPPPPPAERLLPDRSILPPLKPNTLASHPLPIITCSRQRNWLDRVKVAKSQGPGNDFLTGSADNLRFSTCFHDGGRGGGEWSMISSVLHEGTKRGSEARKRSDQAGGGGVGGDTPSHATDFKK